MILLGKSIPTLWGSVSKKRNKEVKWKHIFLEFFKVWRQNVLKRIIEEVRI